MEECESFAELAHRQLQRVVDERGFIFLRDHGRSVQEKRLSNTELDRKAREIAVALWEREATDSPALIVHSEGLDFLAAFLGCLYAGATAVPVPPPDRDADFLARLDRILADIGNISAVLTTSDQQASLSAWLEKRGLGARVACLTTDIEQLATPDLWSLPELRRDDVVLLQYTSGSTREPKGVMVTNTNLLHNEQEIRRGVRVTSESIGVGWLPHYHDMGLIGQLLMPTASGARCVLMSPATFVKRPLRWLEAISHYRATHTFSPNFGYDLCLRRVGADQCGGLDLSSLKVALNGAEPIRADVISEFTERFRTVGFDPGAFAPCYGMAEATLLITCRTNHREPTIHEVDPAWLERGKARPPRSTTSSRPVVGCGAPGDLDVRIVDPDTHAELPQDEVGEIWVCGTSVAAGYYGRPQLSRETFDVSTAAGEGGYLRTGDLGYLHDRELFVTGRLKDVLIVRGRNIYPQDVEEEVRALSPATAAGIGAVFSAPGDHHFVVVQGVAPRMLAGDETLADLAALIRSHVARSFQAPVSRVVLVPRSGIARTTSGKVQRSLTRELLETGQMDVLYELPSRPVSAAHHESTAAEEAVRTERSDSGRC